MYEKVEIFYKFKPWIMFETMGGALQIFRIMIKFNFFQGLILHS